MLILMWTHFIISFPDNVLSHFLTESEDFQSYQCIIKLVHLSSLLPCTQGAGSCNSGDPRGGMKVAGFCRLSQCWRQKLRGKKKSNKWIIHFTFSLEHRTRSFAGQLTHPVAPCKSPVDDQPGSQSEDTSPGIQKHKSSPRKGIWKKKS